MKEENTTEQSPLTKDNLPEVMYPGVPLSETDSNTPVANPTDESETSLTPEEQEHKKNELAKAKTGAVIYTIAFVVNIVLCLKLFNPMFAVIEEHSYYRAMFAVLLSIPTIVSVPAAILTRIIVNYPVRKGVMFYAEAILFLHIIVVRGLKPSLLPLLVLAFEMFFCVTVTCEIIGYKKGDAFYFIKAIAKSLRSKFK